MTVVGLRCALMINSTSSGVFTMEVEDPCKLPLIVIVVGLPVA